MELTDPGFDFTVLTGFRQRLLDHGLEERVLDLLLARLAGQGLVSAGGRQRTDSTHVLAAVRRLNRLEFIGETLRACLEALAAASPQWLASWIEPAWQERYGARTDAYRLPSDRSERDRLAQQIAADGYRLLEAVHALAAPVWLPEIPAVSVLRTVWIQQFTRTVTDGVQTVCWRGKEDLPAGRALIASPYDAEARYSQKRGSPWTGYKVHLSEDCSGAGQPHLITHVVTTDATSNDATVVDAPHPLPRPGQDTPGPRPGGHRRQPDPARRLVERHTPRPNQNIPTRDPRAHSMNELGNRVPRCTRRSRSPIRPGSSTVCGSTARSASRTRTTPSSRCPGRLRRCRTRAGARRSGSFHRRPRR